MRELWRRSRGALPINSDVELFRNVAGVAVPIRLRPSYIALAALGGTVGTAVRFGLTQITPRWETISLGTILVNLLGPFMLGLLLQSLALGAETPIRRNLRLLIGVGFLGAFTSYAQLAVDAVTLFEKELPILAVVYALATIVTGAVAAWAGIYLASRWRDRKPSTPEHAQAQP